MSDEITQPANKEMTGTLHVLAARSRRHDLSQQMRRAGRRRTAGLLGFAVMLLAPVLAAQDVATWTSTLRGRITTDGGRRTLEGVEIRVEGRATVARSGAGGRFVLSIPNGGPITVFVRHPGFRPVLDSVAIESGEELERNFELTPLPTSLAAVEIREEGGIAGAALRDFERRRKGSGKFLVQADIERIGTKSLESLIRSHIGGFSLVRLPTAGWPWPASEGTNFP